MTTQNSTVAGLVNLRLWKELRLLWLPAAVGAVAACLIPVFSLLEFNIPEGIFSLLKGFAWLGFLGCILLISSAPFGWEFQHRTMSMLLAQPYSRWRMWTDKMLAASLWSVALCLFGWLIYTWASKFEPSANLGEFIKSDAAFLPLLVPAALCAAPFCTLTTRSTVGGVTFTVATQFMAGLVVVWIAEKTGLHQGVALSAGAIFYSVTFLWLSWRMFLRLEATEGPALARSESQEANASQPASLWQKVRWSWAGKFVEAGWLDRALRCVPTGATANLFRKELRLQKPVYQVGAFFALCWVVVFGLNLLQSGKGYDNLFDILIAFYVPLVFLLAGSISISDENALGVSGWHLTLPVPARRQWTVKLVSSLAAGVAVGWVLPLMMLCITGLAKAYSTRWAVGEPGAFLVCTSMALFIMSFWAVSLVGNTVRAVMMALLGIVVLFFAFLLAHWWARTNGGFSAIGMELLVGAVSVTVWNNVARSLPFVVAAFLLVIAAVALLQSFLLFRRPDGVRRSLLYYPAALILGALLMGAVIGDLESLRWRNQSQYQNLIGTPTSGKLAAPEDGRTPPKAEALRPVPLSA